MSKADGTEWFWRIVDRNGIADVPSDEEAALKLILHRLRVQQDANDRSVEMIAKAKWVQIGRVAEGNAVTLMFANADDARPVYQAFSDIQDWKGAAEGVDPDKLWDQVCGAGQ